MKIVKRKFSIFAAIIIPTLLITYAAFFFKTAIMGNLFYSQWLMVAICCLLVILPSRRLRLTEPDSELSVHHTGLWFLQIIIIEGALLILSYGIFNFISHTLPILTSPHAHMTYHALHYSLMRFGLLPWSTIAITCCALAFYSYRKKHDAFFSHLLLPGTQHNTSNPLGIAINTLMRTTIVLSLSVTTALIVLMLLNALTLPALLYQITGWQLSTFILAVVLLVLTLMRSTKNRLNRVVTASNPLMTVLLFIVITCIFIAVISILLLKLPAHPIQTPTLLKKLIRISWHDHWQIFTLTWWLLWVPSISLFFARISRGKAIWQVIVATLILPAVITGIMALPGNQVAQWSIWQSPWFTVWLPLLAAGLLFAVLLKPTTMPMMLLAYLPPTLTMKYRLSKNFLQQWLMLMAIILYFYLPAGIYTTNMFLMLLIIPLLVSFIVIAIRLVIATKQAATTTINTK